MAILRRNCPHCPAEHVAFEVKWAENARGYANTWNCIAICGACNKPICFMARARHPSNNPAPTAINGDIEPTHEVAQVWPTRAPSSAPNHASPSVTRRYLEGEDAFRRGNWNSAVAMYRSALDIATKGMEGVPAGQTFFKRLEWMDQNHLITPDIRSWADHVRIEGNAALHDPDDFAQDDAKALRFFTEMFLRYVFELPGEVAKFRGEVDPAAPNPAGQ